MCRVCTTVTPGEPQITLGSDKSFTYDFVFDTGSKQADIFDTCVSPLVLGTLEGYNATILAYGQTGSGKTYTMGTGFDVEVTPCEVGIIPRAIQQLFRRMRDLADEAREAGLPSPQFKVSAQFLEVYHDDVIDLFDPTLHYQSSKEKSQIKIHEDSDHCIYVTGVRSERVESCDEALRLLRQGALSRTTASTKMNAQSSRSHAIFTLYVRQQRLAPLNHNSEGFEANEGEEVAELETLSAKFHFVDLAGSERLKRTGATGARAKEGISINTGLLVLGNVISALGDVSKKALHVPYRDSKLTRLLQDSLGGNSRTLMIACVSPSDSDFMETLNTLKYANRARNIQNKVVINQDKSSRTIALLKKEIQELQLELLEYKQGKRIMNEDGTETVNDMFHENTLLQNEVENLKVRVKGMQETIDSLNVKNSELLAEKQLACWASTNGGDNEDMMEMVKNYLGEIEDLRARLMERESVCSQLRKCLSRKVALSSSPVRSAGGDTDPSIDSLIQQTRRDIDRDLEMVARHSTSSSSAAIIVQPAPSQASESSDTESGDSTEDNMVEEGLSNELAHLTSEITLKQRLIEELEKTQKKLTTMRTHYEEKLAQLQEKIMSTQRERDAMLASYNENKQPLDKVKRIKDDYEKKLSNLQKELKHLQDAKKEHAKMIKSHSKYESQVQGLKNEVMEMKRAKVKLMSKMKEETLRHKEKELRSAKEKAQLMKKNRQDANKIRQLTAEANKKTVVLKRKQEEVLALRKAQQLLFSKRRNNTGRSPKAAKQKWLLVEKNISQNTLNRQSISSLEREMERKIDARKELQEELKLKTENMDGKFEYSSMMKEEVDTMKVSLDHLQQSITELQHEILQIEENKTILENGEILDGVNNMAEASYLADKLYNMALNHAYNAAQKDAEIAYLRARYDQLFKDDKTKEDLLQFLLDRNNSPLERISPPPDASNLSSGSSPTDNGPVNLVPEQPRRSRKKLTLAPNEMLFPPDHSTQASPELMPPPLSLSVSSYKIQSVPSSPALQRKGLPLSPKTSRKAILTSHPSMERLEKCSPPGSPVPSYRRQSSREDNVFFRLTSQPAVASSNRQPGRVTAVSKKVLKSQLIWTHTVEGHSRPVLALHATDDLLFTASQDRNVILWDLHEMKELQAFGNHPNNVVAVKYDPSLRYMFSVTNSFVKIWDIRDYKCIKTLTSTGLTASIFNTIGTNEPQINDIAINSKHWLLYTAAGDKVRIWDLRKFGVLGKLMGGHQAAVMCIARNTANNTDLLYTGSKDHYIKMFEVPVPNISGVITSKVTLEPPHYDGIQCLVVKDNTLFSGSRDCLIKKWTDNELVNSFSSAHKDWVTGMCFVPDSPVLASSCRGGYVKLWSTDSCLPLASHHAHTSSINAIAANNQYLFTASSDNKVKLWNSKLWCQSES